MSPRLLLLPPAASLLLCACGSLPSDPEIDGPEPVSDKVYALGSVQDAVTNGCSTVSVWGLSEQIVAQVNCLVPNAFEMLPNRPNISKGAAVFPFLQSPAVSHLISAVDTHSGTTLEVTSMLRTVAQQYLLYQWAQSGSCGISVAAKPGNSNHEQGLALDVSNYNSWITALEANGFQWYGSGDAVHFTYVGAGANDLSGKDVLAFQMLWNINNPQDKIDEDGVYGPQTEARLKVSPADGFPIPPNCHPNTPPEGALDEAGCDTVRGWARDPDDPSSAIGVHVYFGGPAGDPSATAVQTVANLYRDDLCASLGSCNHGFEFLSPLSLHDGQPHPVYAYGIDSAGGDNAPLGGSPRTLQCNTSVPTGVRRQIAAQAVMDAWHFTPFADVLRISDAALASIPEWDMLPDKPRLVRSDDGSAAVWLIDGPWRRHVPDPVVAAAWEFDLAAAETLPAAEIAAMPEGTPVRARPFLVQGTTPEVYLVDDEQMLGGTDGGTGGGGGSGGEGGASGDGGSGGGWPDDAGAAGGLAGQGGQASTDARADTASGCACQMPGHGRAWPPGWVVGWFLLPVALRRRWGRRR